MAQGTTKLVVVNNGTFAVQADTELPTAAALAIDMATPTAPAVGAFAMGYDYGASNWNPVRVTGDGVVETTATGSDGVKLQQGGAGANYALLVTGSTAHDAVDTGSPLKVGGYAKATAPTAVSADGDRVNAWFDLNGRQAVFDGGGSITVDVASIEAGDNNIGNMDVVTLPSVHFQDLYITGQGSQTAINNNVVLATAGTGTTDTLNGTTGISFRSVSFQVTPAAGTVTAGVITFEGSNDNTNFVSIFLSDRANVTAIPVATITLAASTSRYFTGAIPFRYFRARISTGITGTTTGVQAFTVFSVIPFSDPRLTVSQATAGSLNATVAGSLTTVSTVTTLSGTTTLTPGTGAANLGKAEDAVHTSGDVGVFALGVRADTLADVSGATGDYTQMTTDLKGRLMVGSAPRTLKLNQVTTITSSTTETTIATAVASTFLDLYGLIVTNTSATAVNVAIKDATAGTTRMNFAVPAGDTRGFMLPIDAAVKQSGSNANWTATCSASVASVIVTALTVSNL